MFVKVPHRMYGIAPKKDTASQANATKLNPSRILMGVSFSFLQRYEINNPAEKVSIAVRKKDINSFFEKFISVSGVGPKAACKALAEPFSMIAGAIDNGDDKFLKQLPGIGQQRARLIIAKLQGKVGKYGLIKDENMSGETENENIIQEAIDVLIQLQYKKYEAEEMVKKTLQGTPDIKTSEELLNEIYRERKAIR